MRVLNKSVFAKGKVYRAGTPATLELEDLITNPAHWDGPSRGEVRAAADQDRKDERAAAKVAEKAAADAEEARLSAEKAETDRLEGERLVAEKAEADRLAAGGAPNPGNPAETTVSLGGSASTGGLGA